MFDKKLTILTLLTLAFTTCTAYADKGGFENGGQGVGQDIRENIIPPGQIIQPNLNPNNIQRQELQPLPQQIKRDYNQIQREQKQQFQQNWKKIKK